LCALSGAGAAKTDFVIGYLELDGDPRYQDRATRSHLRGQPWGRPFDGARLALKEGRFAAAAAGVKLELERASAGDVVSLAAALEKLYVNGVRFFLVDAPGDSVAALAERSRDKDLVLFNISALDDALRAGRCQAQLLHVVPSRAMLMDALAQYLVTKKWQDVLVLAGPRPADARMLAAFQRSSSRFKIELVDVREFVLGSDPRKRGQNNVALLTGKADYDVVFVADATGDFAREVPYQVLKPRPVTGGGGLVADWWHWGWERHGAPQLNGRFQKQTKRLMTGYDWAAWMAVKAIVEALLRTRSTDFATLDAFIRGPDIVLDGFKGNRLSFRPWSGQLRQPIFLTTGEWVVARAPLEGFLHAKNDLDTLGVDERESLCRP
jgi:ABC transporter substrate binding protein (PQQ-dependent alcohol dehydrogenase system)